MSPTFHDRAGGVLPELCQALAVPPASAYGKVDSGWKGQSVRRGNLGSPFDGQCIGSRPSRVAVQSHRWEKVHFIIGVSDELQGICANLQSSAAGHNSTLREGLRQSIWIGLIVVLLVTICNKTMKYFPYSDDQMYV
jgi:hypothetical protein